VQVAWLLGWGAAAGVDWLPHIMSSGGLCALTPLHLAAVAHDAPTMAVLLTGAIADVCAHHHRPLRFTVLVGLCLTHTHHMYDQSASACSTAQRSTAL
jgi:hypothetical protein